MKSESRYRLGQSFWVGEMSDKTSDRFSDEDTLQQGLSDLAQYVKRIEW
jgi:hypothetical protein